MAADATAAAGIRRRPRPRVGARRSSSERLGRSRRMTDTLGRAIADLLNGHGGGGAAAHGVGGRRQAAGPGEGGVDVSRNMEPKAQAMLAVWRLILEYAPPGEQISRPEGRRGPESLGGRGAWAACGDDHVCNNVLARNLGRLRPGVVLCGPFAGSVDPMEMGV